MAQRTRNFIVDNSTGTLYTNIDTTANATKVNIAGGYSPKLLRVRISKSGSPVVAVNSGVAIVKRKTISITSIFLEVTDSTGKQSSLAAPVGSSLIVRLRKFNTLNNTTTVLGSYSILSGETSSTNPVGFSILDTDLLFIDVTKVGSIRAGLGLNAILTYFG